MFSRPICLRGPRARYLLAAASLAVACAKAPPVTGSAGLTTSIVRTTASPPADPALAAAFEQELPIVPAFTPVPEILGGTIVLARARRPDVHKGQTIFLAVRRADSRGGPGALVAAQRLQAGDFPLTFSVGATDALIPGGPLEEVVSITARVDTDDDPMTRQKGDVHGRIDKVKVGSQKIVLTLDSLQTADETLDARGMLPGPGEPHSSSELPPGHPRLDDRGGQPLPPGHL